MSSCFETARDENGPICKESMKIVIGAHTPHGTPYVVGSHHLARELKRMGHRVFHVPIPLAVQDLFVSDHVNFRNLRWMGWKTTRRGLDPVQADQFFVAMLPWSVVRWSGLHLAERLGYGVLTYPSIKAAARSDLLIVDHPKQFWLVNVIEPKLLLYRP